ncbi:MAG: hypothetical protein KGL35_04590, partial [Bradyrhizobium sp.]|nr:hypothetical protein [Bradyrhizobium sp.]
MDQTYPPAFVSAVTKTLGFEGGLADDPRDPGGITNFGISLRSHPGLGADGIRALTRDQAIAIYYADPWQRYGYGRLEPLIAEKVFDLAVNLGASESHKLLQRAASACGIRLQDDGVIGPRTESAANVLNPMMLRVAIEAAA